LTTPHAIVVDDLAIKEQPARRRARYTVVAAKIPGKVIVRCQYYTYLSHDEQDKKDAIAMVRQVVGSLDDSIEWTYYNYGSPPSYAQKNELDLPTGIFAYDCTDVKYDIYSQEGRRLNIKWPRGWIEVDPT
jgi:hypothetical protein